MAANRWNDFDDAEFEQYEDEPDDEQTTEVMSCPRCGSEVYEDAEQCPHCGDYILSDTHPFSGRPWWWVALGLLGIAATVIWLVF